MDVEHTNEIPLRRLDWRKDGWRLNFNYYDLDRLDTFHVSDIKAFASTPLGRFKIEVARNYPNLPQIDYRSMNLVGADFVNGYNLEWANFSGSNLTRASLSDAKLKRANFSNANLKDANLRDADLTEAYLLGANLEGTNLLGANLTGAVLPNGDTYTTDTDMSLFTKWEHLVPFPKEDPDELEYPNSTD